MLASPLVGLQGNSVESPQVSAKVDQAALRCLELCIRRPAPHLAAARFIAALGQKPDWTPEEIAELQGLIDWALGRDNSDGDHPL